MKESRFKAWLVCMVLVVVSITASIVLKSIGEEDASITVVMLGLLFSSIANLISTYGR